MIRFSNIPDKLNYPPAVRAKLSMMHSMIIDSAMATYTGKYSQRKRIVDVINLVTASVLRGDTIPANWSPSDLLDAPELPDTSDLKSVLKDLYVVEKNVEWDIIVPEVTNNEPTLEVPKVTYTPVAAASIQNTPKEHLYIQAPVVPRFSPVPWITKTIGTTTYSIYPSEPIVPSRQNEISVTTDISRFTNADLLKLYPNQLIQTRSATMYVPVSELEYHPDLGVIIPIQGYSREQLIDNLIKYPHLYKLQRLVDDKLEMFYTSVEIDGELIDVQDMWHTSPDTASIPWTPEFIKEYVVRRYLLERDNGIEHRYPMYGDLDPFLTLFAPASKYAEWGYTDAVGLARACVNSRIRYKQSRNPVLRRLQDE